MEDSDLYPRGFRSLSVPTYRASTVLFPDFASFRDRGKLPRSGYSYGLNGTPTTRALESRITDLHKAVDTFLVPSGLAAITTTVLSLCTSGDVIAIPDCVYPPVRRFATETLSKLGIRAIYYDPYQPNDQLGDLQCAKLVWIESPGSTTHEVSDFRELRSHADRLGAVLGADNSWASPYLCRPLEHGIDIVIEALSKHLSGHSDILMGSISVGSEALAQSIHSGIRSLGLGVSPDDCFLVSRGLETASLRIRECGNKALAISEAVSSHKGVEKVLFPALPASRDFAPFSRQYDGPGSILTIQLTEMAGRDFENMVRSLEVFTLGASWGGTHSVLAPTVLDCERSVRHEYRHKDLVRLGIGLEDPEALIADLNRFL